MHRVDLGSSEYPSLLSQMQNPPKSLYIEGKLDVFGGKTLVVVGSRSLTPYGEAVVKNFVGLLASRGVVIVSGLARGVDALAHETCLGAGGVAVGVLGFGFDFLSGQSVAPLARRVAASGALISPFLPSQKAEKRTFLERNKIMAGVSKAVLVIEATAKSGVFSTVNMAIELGRDVFVVPGSVFSYTSMGCHELIKEGAYLITSPDDILSRM